MSVPKPAPSACHDRQDTRHPAASGDRRMSSARVAGDVGTSAAGALRPATGRRADRVRPASRQHLCGPEGGTPGTVVWPGRGSGMRHGPDGGPSSCRAAPRTTATGSGCCRTRSRRCGIRHDVRSMAARPDHACPFTTATTGPAFPIPRLRPWFPARAPHSADATSGRPGRRARSRPVRPWPIAPGIPPVTKAGASRT